MFDIKSIETEARNELNEELGKSAKSKIKAKLREINNAERILSNLRLEYAALLKDIGSETIDG